MKQEGENAARFEYFLTSSDIPYRSVCEQKNDIIYLEHTIENGPAVSLGVMISSDNTGIRLYLFNYISIKSNDGIMAALRVINALKEGPVCFIDEDKDIILQLDVPMMKTFSAHSLYRLCEYMFLWAERLYLPLMEAAAFQSN